MTTGTPPRVPFRVIAEHVLGSHGSVSLVFVSPATSKKTNLEKRGKNYVANVLTFPFKKNEGEIMICLPEAKKNADAFSLSYRDMVALLFIHALLHLKGVPHGGTMDRTERRLLKRFQDSRF
jgi:probable rRNA maturation factor